jgi:hypothetical protein
MHVMRNAPILALHVHCNCNVMHYNGKNACNLSIIWHYIALLLSAKCYILLQISGIISTYCFIGIMSLLRHSVLRQSLLRHLLLRQSLLRLLILRQWPIVFAILAHLAIQMQYGTAHFIPELEVFFVCSAIVFKAFQRGPTNTFYKRKYYFM